jgi:hypothetical protein
LKQAVFEIRREECLIAFKKFRAGNLAIHKAHVLQAAAIQLDEAKIAVREGTCTEFCTPQNSFSEVTAVESASGKRVFFQIFPGKIFRLYCLPFSIFFNLGHCLTPD